VARNDGWNDGPPDDRNFPNDAPTQYLGPPIGELPWYRRPAALVAFGAIGAVVIALIVFGLAKLITGGNSPSEQTSLTPLSTTSRSAPANVAPSTRTVTETITPTTTASQAPTTTTTEPTTTTTTATTTTSVSTSTSTSTVTQTVTVSTPAP
jgi:cytoskeletal protein RodZ